jgi:peptidyl-prolyl cis-trans isomerase SurA
MIGNNRPMKRMSVKLALASFFFVIAFTSMSQDTLIDGIIGIVGGNVILKSDIEGQYMQMRAEGSIAGSATTMKCTILDNLLFQKLLVHQAGVDSLTVSDSQVDAEMDRRMRYFIAQAGSPDELEKFYGKSIVQIKEELRDVVKEQMLAQQEQSKITEKVTISPAEVKAFYKKIPKDSLPEIPSEVEVGMISKVPQIGEAEKQIARERLKGLRERVLKGDDFATLAVLYSEDPGSASKGGELGMFQRGTMRPEFEAAAFKLKPGEVSDVVETEDGFHIIQMVERRGEYISVRHILLQPKVSQADLNKAKLFLDSVATLVATNKITFDQAVLKFSDDPSRNNGGMMINPETGDKLFEMNKLDPKVFFVIDKLKEGEISTATKWEERGKVQFRIYYLRKRTDPHQADLGQDYTQVQQWALDRKKYEAIQAWVEEKVKSTYIYIAEPYTQCNFERHWIPAKEE